MKQIRPSTQTAIIEAAFELLNQDPKSSLAQIADHAGVSRATLHRHFSSRDDLIMQMINQALEETEQAANQASKLCSTYAEAIEQIIKAIIPLGNRHWFLSHEHVANNTEVQAQLKQQEIAMDNLITQSKKEGLFDSQLPNAWISQIIDHMIHAAWEMIKSDQLTTSQATQLAWSTLIKGLNQA